MSPRVPHNSHTGSDTVSTAGESIRPRVGDIQARAFELNPPSMIRWYVLREDQVGGSDPCHSMLAPSAVCVAESSVCMSVPVLMQWPLPFNDCCCCLLLMTANCDMHSALALAHASLRACGLICGVHATGCASFHGSTRKSLARFVHAAEASEDAIFTGKTTCCEKW